MSEQKCLHNTVEMLRHSADEMSQQIAEAVRREYLNIWADNVGTPRQAPGESRADYRERIARRILGE